MPQSYFSPSLRIGVDFKVSDQCKNHDTITDLVPEQSELLR